MTLRTRRIIAFLFIAGFLVLAPILILYSAGYRYNFKNGQFKKTGAVFMETEPKGALIFIDGQTMDQKTPAHLTNIFPNFYTVRLEKEGYLPWEKKIEIKPQETVFANNVVLFKNQPAKEIEQEDKIIDILKTPSCVLLEALSATDEKIFSCLNDKSGLIQKIYKFDDADVEISAQSSDKNKFLAGIKSGDFQILSTDGVYKQTLADLPIDLAIVKWDETSDHFIYGGDNSEIWQINLLGLEPVYTLTYRAKDNETINDFAVSSDRLYLVVSGEDGNFLRLTDVKNPNDAKQSIQLLSSNFKIDSFIDQYIVIKDSLKSDIYFMENNLAATKLHLNDIDRYDWLEKEKLMVLYNDYEIYFSNFKETTPITYLVTRYSTPIKKIVWFNDNYLLVLHDGRLKIIEMDNRDKRNVFELNNENDLRIDNFALDQNKEKISFISGGKLFEQIIQ
ncbi:MAG TPA: PEGA domain-containing protein [Candidatus Bipolaricaulota bacterium]|nr:PEGA domain-containing protein [Candidatus Bipolaricaulota bacterium]